MQHLPHPVQEKESPSLYHGSDLVIFTPHDIAYSRHHEEEEEDYGDDENDNSFLVDH